MMTMLEQLIAANTPPKFHPTRVNLSYEPDADHLAERVLAKLKKNKRVYLVIDKRTNRPGVVASSSFTSYAYVLLATYDQRATWDDVFIDCWDACHGERP